MSVNYSQLNSLLILNPKGGAPLGISILSTKVESFTHAQKTSFSKL